MHLQVFAYGQTGSGKTYTMFGKGFDTVARAPAKDIRYMHSEHAERAGMKGQSTVASVADPAASEDRGIIPRSIYELFSQIRSTQANVTVYCSFVQIYNEKIFDLLNDPKQLNPLSIREDRMQGIYVEGLSEFVGVRRRFELHEGPGGGGLVNDYAHHPVEIEAVLQTARRRFPDRRILVAFQPHQYQRTLLLLDQFAASLAAADTTLIAEIYGARESDEIMASVSAGDLVNAVREHGGDAHYGGPARNLTEQVAAHRQDGDVVLLLGAGDIDESVGGIVARI